MKSLMSFVQCVLKDLGTWCDTSTDRDLKTISDRFEHEGIEFLTLCLPNFGRDLERALDQGFVAPRQFLGFSRGSAGLPRFLRGFLEQVFDPSTGVLLDDPSTTCIWAVRQLTLMFAKISLPCSDARQKGAVDAYIKSEKEVREADANADPIRVERFARISSLLWGNLLSVVDQQVFYGEVTAKHGPGSTAEKLLGNKKWTQREWTRRLESVFPHWEHLIPNERHLDSLADVQILDPGQERPVRVVLVPKTHKSPRVIALEPACMQYMQQALLGSLRKAVDADDIASSLIGWASQVPNQHLAHQGSRDGTLATLDLSEASDRVSYQHVRVLLRNHPHLLGAVDSTRSRKADVPGHGVKRLAKFASMGSALTFPIESMVFMTMVFVGIEEALNRPVTKQDVRSLLGQVRVYGDDIIVPVDYVYSVVEILESFGLKVNSSKSFWSGKFRESCGKEYYSGTDVSIVRMRSIFPVNRADAREMISSVEFRNRLYYAGMWKSARWLEKELGRLIPLPTILRSSPLLGRHTMLDYEIQYACEDLHVPLVKGMMKIARSPSSVLENESALMKCLALSASANSDWWEDITIPPDWHKLFIDLPVDDEHLLRSGRPKSVSTKLGWSTPY